jgi:hypothetical protein
VGGGKKGPSPYKHKPDDSPATEQLLNIPDHYFSHLIVSIVILPGKSDGTPEFVQSDVTLKVPNFLID